MKVYQQPNKNINEGAEDESTTLNYTTTKTLYIWPKIVLSGDIDPTAYSKEFFLIPQLVVDNLNIPIYNTLGDIVGYRENCKLFEADYIDTLFYNDRHKTVNVWDIQQTDLIAYRNKYGEIEPTLECEEGSYYIAGYWRKMISTSYIDDWKESMIPTINSGHVKGYYTIGGTKWGTQRLYCKWASFNKGGSGEQILVSPRMSEAERLRGPYHKISDDFGNVRYIWGGGATDNYITQGPHDLEGYIYNKDNLCNKIIYPTTPKVLYTMTIDNEVYSFYGIYVLGGK